MVRGLALLLVVLVACSPARPATPPRGTGGSGGEAGGSGGSAAVEICSPGATKACYPSVPGNDVGACRYGVTTCAVGGLAWGPCQGAVTPVPEGDVCDGVDQDCNGIVDDHLTNACGACGPLSAEICANGLDDDCNGIIDDPAVCNQSCKGVDPVDQPCCGGERPSCEHLDCEERTDQPCYSGPPQTAGKGICHGGKTSCGPDDTGQLAWSGCEGEQKPLPEVCSNGLDDDCDGLIDEDDSHGRACPHSGTCADGSAPRVERCGDGIDSDCNGLGGPGESEDPGCCVPAGEEVCNGADDDCDGLVDEGVVDACGKCGNETCTTLDEHEPANAAEGTGRTSFRIAPDPNNPDSMTIDQIREQGLRYPWVYFAVPDRHTVVSLDSATGLVRWEADTLGDVTGPLSAAMDGSVWAVNRGTIEPAKAGVVHFDRDGNLVCRAPVPPEVTAVDTGGEFIGPGMVWVGRRDPPELWVFALQGTTGLDADGIPVCTELAAALSVPEPVTALALDLRGILWTASGTTHTVRLDTATLALDRIEHHTAPTGVVVDWLDKPFFTGANVHRILADGPYVDPGIYETDAGVASDALAMADDGTLWGSDASGLLSLDPEGLDVLARHPVADFQKSPGQGIGQSADGSIWVPMLGGSAYRLDPFTSLGTKFDIAVPHDLAGRGIITPHGFWKPRRPGTWTQLVDSGYAQTFWTRLEWTSNVPRGTGVTATAVFADTEAGLESSILCTLEGSPADLSVCPFAHRSRFALIGFTLDESPGHRVPTVGHIQISYTRP